MNDAERNGLRSKLNQEEKSTMKSVIGRRLRNGILFTFLWCSVGAAVNGRALSADDPPRAPCAAPAYHQFDFWLGDWDVFEVGSPTKVAHARGDSILDG